jgi:hypothetical protein
VRRAVSLLAAVLILTLAWPRPAAACSCVPPEPPPQAFTGAHAVFSGTVTQINPGGSLLAQWYDTVRQWLGLPITAGAQSVVVQVTQSWKGVQSTPIRVQTDGSSAMCGFPFTVGQQYVIYSYSGGGPLSASSCSRTAELSHATADLAYLQTLPTLTVQASASSGWLVWLGLGGAVVVAATLLTGAVWWVRRATQKKEAT